MPAALPAAAGLLAGVLSVQWLPALPPHEVLVSAVLVAMLCAWRLPRHRWLGCILLGFAWAAWCGGMAMDARLPRGLEGEDIVVTGAVVGLPQVHNDASRFDFLVEHAQQDDQPLAFSGKVTLSWYRRAPPIRACSRWQLVLRLKRPRGLINPGGADSERTALARRIVATGYVRDGKGDEANNRLLSTPRCIDGARDAIASGITARVADAHDAALLRAFAVGDTRGLEAADWEVARANGVSHLIAISGFHVGVAAVSGVWLVSLVYWLWPGFGFRLPRPLAQAGAAVSVAAFYSALAGFGLPTVRTLLMIAVVALARCGRRHGGGAQSLALALIAILLTDPLSVLAAGFWLSFVGVSFLMLCLHARGSGWRAFVHELSMGQLVMTVALLPLSLWFFGEASLVGALSNLIAVPFVSFVIVPCVLFGTLLLGVCPPLAAPVLWLAAQFAHAQWWLLEKMATWPGAHWYLPSVQLWALLFALLGSLWLFMPRGLPLRWLGLLLFLPLLLPPRPQLAEGAFEVWMLDVGQGLSVLLRTREHVLLYDAGARFPSGFDLGEAVVLPSMHALGLDRLDLMMISHGDNDHAGGAQAVATAFPQARRYAGEPARMPMPTQPCAAGQAWQWDGVQFRVLSPPASGHDRDNDSSCVLLVQSAVGRLLLTGDISARIEKQLAKTIEPGLSPVLQVPHHGSKTSSSDPFITTLTPSLALVSAGWRNRFGHPKPEVVARYRQAGVRLLNTAEQGAIGLAFVPDRFPPLLTRWRPASRRYWRE